MGRRDAALEIFRGIAILEVVLHHVSSFARINCHPGTPSQLFYAVANRSLHFAVPAFLFLMGLLLTRAMADGKRSWREFYTRRAQQTLVPYLIWTVLYAFFALWTDKTTAEALRDPATWRHWLLWGKAWEHLYFLVLALQLYLFFPFLIEGVRRAGERLGWLLAGAGALQVAIYWANFAWVRAPYPGALLAWHVIPALAGVWVGLHLDEWDRIWSRLRWLAVPLGIAGWLAYLPQGLLELRGHPVNTFQYQVALWAYTTGVCFCLLQLCRGLARRGPWLARGLQVLGAQSMQIYLVHPMLLYFWYVRPQAGSTLRFHLTVAAVTVITLAGSLLIARVAARFPLGRVVFGRGDVPLAPLPGRA